MKQLLITGLFLLLAHNHSDWLLKKEDSGIEIYIRSVEGSEFYEFKGITVIPDITLSEVLDPILDVKNYESLFPDCMNPEILLQKGMLYDIHYLQIKGPFPVKDRDIVYEQTTEIDNNGKHARTVLKPVPDYIPEREGMIRMRKGTGFWDLEEDNARNVKVVYQFHSDPGGGIPAVLVNSFLVRHPYKTLLNLKRRLNR